MKPIFTLVKNLSCIVLLLFCTSSVYAYDLVVAKDGSGDYTTVQAAINAAPAGLTSVYTIYVKDGIYNEVVVVPSSKPFLQLVGQSVAKTIITYNNGATTLVGGSALGTSGSATFTINANNFSAMNITFENTFGDGSQAVAVEVNADMVAFQNCRFMGNQDTLYTKGSGNPRAYFLHCYIDGNVDFMFGSSIVVFDTCEIYAKTRTVVGSTGTSYMTAANTTPGQAYGYVFRGCTVPRNQGTTFYYLGRPWQNSTGFTPTSSPPQADNKVVYLNTTLGAHIYPAGWVIWDAGTDTSVIYDGEYKSTNFDGTLTDVSSRVTWSYQLSDSNAATYTLANIFAGWDPCTLLSCGSGFTPTIAVSNFMATKGVTASSVNWNISWPLTGIQYQVYRSTDGVSYSLFNTQTAANDTNVNFSTTDVIPPAGSIYHYYVVASLPGYESDSSDTVIISSAPTITLSDTLASFTQYLGTPSGVQTYSVGGTNLADSVTLIAPGNFQISSDGGTTWHDSTTTISFAEVGGILVPTTVYVRLNASANGSYSGRITHVSTGADTVYELVSGTTTNPPLIIPVTLEEWPFTTGNTDSAAVRATGVAGTVPTLNHLYVSAYSSQPAYSAAFGQSLSANDGVGAGYQGDGYWTSNSPYDGPGGNLHYGAYYEEFTLVPQPGYNILLDSFILNATFDGTSSSTSMMATWSLSNFTLDSSNIYGYTFAEGAGSDIVLPNETSANTNVVRIALVGAGASVTVPYGDTLRIRFHFTCSSTGDPRWACLKDVIAKGITTACVAEPGSFTISSANVCLGESGVEYTVPADTAVTSYTWSYSGTGASFTSTANSVSIDFGSTATSGTLSVVANAACGTSAAQTMSVTVNALPDPGVITGTYTVCSGATTTLGDTVTGGVWGTGDATIALVDPSLGIVTGESAGPVVITYSVTNSAGCTSTTTATVTVSGTAPAIGAITGITSLCPGAATTLSDTTAGGTWSSSDVTIATVSSLGAVTGIASGSANISYTVANSCGSAITYSAVTVNPLPLAGVISGTTSLCQGVSTTLSDAGSLGIGVWSSSDVTIASVDASGDVTGILTGTVAITYSVTNSCGSTSTDSIITVDPLPLAGIISGSTSVCPGALITLSDAGSLGIGSWSSSNTGIATVDGSGNVNGISSGTVAITYSVTNSCGSVSASSAITVDSLPLAGIISGSTTLCPAGVTILSDAGSLGTGSWSSSNTSIASVDLLGTVTAISSGTVAITYSVTNSCGSASTYSVVTVTPLPLAGIISGTTTLCTGSIEPFTDAGSIGTGVWSSSNASVASVSATGVVTGISAGFAIIYYTSSNICGLVSTDSTVTVGGTLSAGIISGLAAVCPGGNITLTDAGSSVTGTWSSSDAGIASVNSSGAVTGVSSGTADISYLVTGTCGSVYTYSVFTVNPLPLAGTLSGTTTLCAGTSASLTDAGSAGIGTWTSSNTGIASVDASGNITAVSSGTVAITYSVTNSCGSAFTASVVTVNPLPVAGTISGTTTLCVGASSTFTDAGSVGTGIWSSGGTGIASVDAAGNVTAVSSGTVGITYSVSNSCGSVSTNSVVTVNPLPVAGTISGNTVLCAGASATLTNAGSIGTGTWISGNTSIASVDASGNVTAIASGTVAITYSVTNSCGSIATDSVITVDPVITLTASVANSGSTYTVTTNATAYTVEWYVNGVLNTTFTTTPTWTFSVAAGDTDAISATITPISGCYSPDILTTDTLNVNGGPLGIAQLTAANNISVYPNPSSDQFIVKGCTQGDVITITDLSGNEVVRYISKGNSGGETVSVTSIAPGMYLMHITAQGGSRLTTLKVVKQ